MAPYRIAALSGVKNSVRIRNASLQYGPFSAFPHAFARFNSTSSAAASESAASQTQPASFSDLPSLAIEQIPEKAGYLKELGLDYGWGPSSIIQFLIEHIHIWTGLPWWASIVGTGLLVRVALFKPTLSASDNAAKVQKVKPVIDPIRSHMLQQSRTGNSAEIMKSRAELQELYKKHDIKMWRSFVPLLQIPIGYGCFRVVRGMAALPVPGLATESVAWLKDLTVNDPYFILPAMTAGFLYLTFKVGITLLSHYSIAANCFSFAIERRGNWHGRLSKNFIWKAFFVWPTGTLIRFHEFMAQFTAAVFCHDGFLRFVSDLPDSFSLVSQVYSPH
jgi:membrane protein insertase Oxa1/YidC/SpoIIIJ